MLSCERARGRKRRADDEREAEEDKRVVEDVVKLPAHQDTQRQLKTQGSSGEMRVITVMRRGSLAASPAPRTPPAARIPKSMSAGDVSLASGGRPQTP